MTKLNVKQISALKDPGMYGDGMGLYLNIASGGSKTWILRVTIKGQTARREIGLGSIHTLSLAEARAKAKELRAEAKQGRDPRLVRDHYSASFEEVARELHESLSPRFRNEKHKAQWLSSLQNHAFPKLGKRPVEDIQRHEIHDVLLPIWVKMHPTAKRLKQRMNAVFDFAIGKNLREASNPVDGALMRSLGAAGHRTEHHVALDWRDIPEVMAELEAREAMSALALRFIVLTATRSGETRMATWDEFNLSERTWTIPGSRMKSGNEHRIPLSEEAMAIVQCVRGMDPVVVFPSQKGKPLSVNAFRPLFDRMGRKGLTAHGFRSSFRDWCAEKAHADREIAEAALSHTVGGVEGAYFRSDVFDRRRKLMDAWGRFTASQGGDVLQLVRDQRKAQ